MRARRFAVLWVLMALMVCLGVLPCAAQEGNADAFTSLPPEYEDMLRSLPDAVRASLPEGVLSTDPGEAAAAMEQFLTPASLLRYLIRLLLADVSLPLSLLLGVCGVLVLRAVMDCMATGIGGGMSEGFSLLCRLCFCLLLVKHALSVLQQIRTFFDALHQLTLSYLPLMSAMYLSGGNVAVATVNQGTLIFSNALVSLLGGESVVPMVAFCLSLMALGTVDGTLAARMSHISGKIKKWYTTALALTMLLLGSVLAAQTTLAARADSLAFKTVRFVVSSNIPFVGGGVAEMMRSASTGISWLRSLVGIGGVVLLLALLLPSVCRVLLCRLVCTLGADVAAWLGCGEEGRLLGEIGGLYGYLIAVISLSCMTFFFSLILLLQCATAF